MIRAVSDSEIKLLTPALAWALGIFEGEGCIVVTHSRNSVALAVAMTDEDTIRSLHFVVGAGMVNGPYRTGNRKKPVWRWILHNSTEVKTLLGLWLPYFSTRRNIRAQFALTLLEKVNNKDSPVCKYGHVRANNTYIHPTQGRKSCRVCRNLKSKQYYYTHKRSV